MPAHTSRVLLRLLGMAVLMAGAPLGCDSLVSAPLDPFRTYEPPEACPPESLTVAAEAPVRRLSNVEYWNTLRDLFVNVDMPTTSLPNPALVHGFEHFAESQVASPLLVERHHIIARRIAERAVENRADLLPCDPAPDPVACARQFIADFGRRVHRRPLDEESVDAYLDFFVESMNEIDFDAALELTITAFLNSPEFVYRLELSDEPAASLDGYQVATRLSYFLWQSTPDETLLAAAAAGALTSTAGIEAQAKRLLAAPRAADAVADFYRQWLEMDKLLEQRKDSGLFPQWSYDVAVSARDESLRFIKLLYERDELTMRNLLTSPLAEVDGNVAPLYGLPQVSDWTQVELDASRRAGILTRVGFLGAHAHNVPSPPLRGVAVLRKFLCLEPPPPPPSADTSTPLNDGPEPRTNRELFERRLEQSTSCKDCHRHFDGIGYAFEHYDAIGQYRAQDAGLPVDAEGSAPAIDEGFADALALSELLADTNEVTHCVADSLYQLAFAREVHEDDLCKVDAVAQAMRAQDGDLKAAMLAIATSHEFRTLARRDGGQ